MSELGDRILNSSDGDREDAITCYLAGGALDKLANLWLQELPEYESELLESDATRVSSPSEARLHVLTNFVEKISTYKFYSKKDGAITGPLVDSISKALLEFVNLVAGSGEFDLAQKVLQLLPNELAGVEKERILKATGKDVKVQTPPSHLQKLRLLAKKPPNNPQLLNPDHNIQLHSTPDYCKPKLLQLLSLNQQDSNMVPPRCHNKFQRLFLNKVTLLLLLLLLRCRTKPLCKVEPIRTYKHLQGCLSCGYSCCVESVWRNTCTTPTRCIIHPKKQQTANRWME